MALLDYLYNAFADQPIQRDDAGQVTNEGVVPGILNGLGNNSNTLMQVGLGLMSGKDNSDAFRNAQQGLQSGSEMDQRQMLINQRFAKDKRSQDSVAAYLKANPGMAKYIADPTNPQAVQGLADRQFEIANRPKQFSYHTAGDGSLYAIDQADPSQIQKLGVPATMSETDKMLQNAGATAEQRQQFYRTQAGLDGAKPTLTSIDDPGSSTGKRSVLQTMPTKDNPTGLWELDGKTPAQGATAPSNPYALPGGKVTEESSKNAGYANRMATSHQIISQNEDVNQGFGGALGGSASNAAGDYGPNWMKSGKRQAVEQAERDFVNSVLRRESGAAISAPEFENARRQYFPQPGDTPQVIEQKRQNRETTLQGVMGGAGPTYKPPAGWEGGKAPSYGSGVPGKGQTVKLPNGATITREN